MTVKLTARCPQCAHEFTVDSGYLGTKRKCPECGQGFVFEQPLEVTDAGGDVLAVKQALGVDQRVACPSCLRLFKPSAVFQDQTEQRCAFCDCRMTMAEAQETARVVLVAEPAIMAMLLLGVGHGDVLPQLAQQGVTADGLPLILDRQRRQLPFERFSRRQNHDIEVPLMMATDCDLCGTALRAAEQRQCVFVHWFVHSRASQSHPVWQFAALFATVVAWWLLSVRRQDDDEAVTNEMKALYCLCAKCRRSLDAVFGAYAGFPASGGFKVRKLAEYPVTAGELPTKVG